MNNLYASIAVGLFYVWQPAMALGPCNSSLLAGLDTAVTEPTFAHIPPGITIDQPNAAGGCASSFNTSTNMCRVTFGVPTSSESGINMEVWMPDNWEGRYVSTGNFGINGCVLYSDLVYLTSLGLAVGGADGGHSGEDGSSFANNIEIIKDYSFRSVHNMTTIAKQVVETYYGSAPNNNYYYGCSTGGRQGLQSAQMFPDDFDGIIASSAAADFNNLAGWSGSFFPTTGPAGSPTFVTGAQWNAIHVSVMEQCDGIDGVIDNIIEDPDLCNFDPGTLLCQNPGSDPSTCLDSIQVETVRKVLGPLRDDTGNLLFPQLQPGVEDVEGTFYFNGDSTDIPTQWYQFAIFNNSGYNPALLNNNTIVEGDQLDLGSISTWSGDLSAFQSRGGKLITAHGLVDNVITSTNSARYYKHVSATMSLPPTSLDDFYRYFRISGMAHCGDGPGAWEIGLTESFVPNTPQQNIVFALFDWVENGNAPDTLLGTKYVNDDATGQIAFQRNHCRYPFRTNYTSGDPNLASSWGCVPIVNPSLIMEEET